MSLCRSLALIVATCPNSVKWSTTLARKNQQALLLAPMEEAELEDCLWTIFADRLPANPYKLLADELFVDIETVATWFSSLVPFPQEIACGLRVRAAVTKGDLAPLDEAALSAIDSQLVSRWVFERASRNELAKLFSALAGRLHDLRDPPSL